MERLTSRESIFRFQETIQEFVVGACIGAVNLKDIKMRQEYGLRLDAPQSEDYTVSMESEERKEWGAL